jgi:AraC-like DNA-binding protein
MIAGLRLLADGLDVTSVALDVGYQTQSAFVAAFRREMGTTPGVTSPLRRRQGPTMDAAAHV